MRLAVIAGDGIGPEVVAEGLKVLREVAPDIESTDYDLGAMRWQRTGELLPDTVVEELRQHDAILLGAIGDPSVPPGILERGLLLRLRFELDHHVNLRPAKLFDGVTSPLADPGPIDMLCVREGTEGPYVGNGGVLRKDTPQEVATEVSLNTAFGVERVVRYAFERAAHRPRKHLTLIHKTNVLTHAEHVDGAGVGQRALDAVVELGRPQVDVVVELEAQPQQQAALEDPRRHARVTDGAEEDRVVLAQLLDHRVGQQLAGALPAHRTEVVRRALDVGRDLTEDLQALGHHLGTDAVPRDHCQPHGTEP